MLDPNALTNSCLSALAPARRLVTPVLAVALVGTFMSVPVYAGEDGLECTCMATGQKIELGKTVCIRMSSGKDFLARCERFLNNTSWKRLQDGCPSVSNRTPLTSFRVPNAS